MAFVWQELSGLSSPDTPHPIFTHAPASESQQCGNPPYTVATVLTGQRDNRLREPIFVEPLCGLVALCPPWLTHQATGVPFTQSFFPGVLNGDAAPLGT